MTVVNINASSCAQQSHIDGQWDIEEYTYPGPSAWNEKCAVGIIKLEIQHLLPCLSRVPLFHAARITSGAGLKPLN
jgi:hypothetical protein